MKVLKKFVWLLASVALVACGNDDDNSTPFELTSETILGTYEMTDYSISTTTVGELGGTIQTVGQIETDANFQNVELVLTATNTYEVTGFITRNIEDQDGEVIAEDEIINATTSGTYLLNTVNEEITFTTTDETADFVLDGVYSIGLTSSRLELDREEEFVDVNGDTETVVESFSFTSN